MNECRPDASFSSRAALERPGALAARLALVLALAAGSLPAGAQDRSVRALSGGAGSDEATQMRQQQSRYSAAMIFARPGGEYLADVKVRITRADGTLVYEHPAAGPWLLIDLPPGHYRVRAEQAGQARSTQLDIARGRTVQRVITWDKRA